MISTERLHIKPFTQDDAAAFFQLSKDEGFNLHPINIYRQSSVESSRDWIQKTVEVNQQTNLGKWGVWQGAELIGLGGLTPWIWEGEELVDVTYRLRESAWGKGLGWELASALLDFGRDKKHLTNITATITPENIQSRKLAERLGFHFDQRILLLGVPTDLYRLKT